SSIAFPAISTGVFGYPVEPAAEVAIGTVLETVPRLSALRLVRLVLYSRSDLQIHEQVLKRLTAKLGCRTHSESAVTGSFVLAFLSASPPAASGASVSRRSC